ncbi:uncharacterized protein LOC127130992 [Lathyrus oleraceus]|uniref:uncharacterized protein LOC127130992 n=1 Tax=Pisum sativum TaxID=3888 RepID=UPI0021D0B49B|nr:uncharacterized protein LOC127130992 [Pisum sativum]
MGKIQNFVSTSSASNKPFVPYGKKQEGETNAASIIRTRNPTYPQVTAIAPVQPSQQKPFAIPVQTQQKQRYQQQLQRQQPQYQQQQQRMRRLERRFDPVPMPYSHILPYLLRGSLVQLRELGHPPAVLPPGYDANTRCEFHFGAPGHSIENYKALKYKVQDLIDSKAITFSPKGPNVNNNPMPPHNNASVNMMEADNGRRLMSCVDKLKTPLIEIKNALMKNNAFPICGNDCEHCLINPQQCRTLKSVIQKLMNQGILVVDYPSTKEDVSTLEIPYDEVPPLQIRYDFSQLTLLTNPVTPIIITFPTPFPHVDTKAVPWMYDTSVYIHGQKIQEEPLKSSDPMINITGTSGITRSGRIFVSTPTLIGTINPSTSDKGKQIDGAQQRQDPAPSNEVDEFLRIIKKSDYRVVDQLNQTPSKIPMLSLLMCSEAHRDALVKFLRTAHVPQEIPVCQFEGVVNNIATSLSLGEGEIREVPLQSFEVINVEMVCPSRDESKDAESPMASLKDALRIIKDGHPQGWGRLLELPANKDRTGLGYNSQNLKKPAPIATRGSVLPLSENFLSAGYLDDNRICVVEEEEEEEDDRLIFTKTDGNGATKWTEIEIPKVILIEM